MPRGVKLPGLEVDHLPHPEPTLRISGAVPLLPHIFLHCVDGENFSSTYYLSILDSGRK